MDDYSVGPFSRVYFMLCDGVLHTYRYRTHNIMDKGSLINTLGVVIYAGGPRFHEIYLRTSQ